jgi:hypothetical protein
MNLFRHSVALRVSSVGRVLSYGLDDRSSGVRFPAGAGHFSLHHRVQNGSGAQSASYPMGTRVSFPGDKAAGAWSWSLTSHLMPMSKNEKSYTSTPQYAFMAWCLVQHRDFTFFIESFCDHGNEPWCFTKSMEFLDHLSDCHIFKECDRRPGWCGARGRTPLTQRHIDHSSRPSAPTTYSSERGQKECSSDGSLPEYISLTDSCVI